MYSGHILPEGTKSWVGIEEGKEDEYDDLSARSRDEDSNKKDLEGKSNIFVWGDNLHGQLSVIEDQALVHDPIAINLS